MTALPTPHLVLVHRDNAHFLMPCAAACEKAAQRDVEAVYPDASVVAALSVSGFLSAGLFIAAQQLHDAVAMERDTDAALAELARSLRQYESRSLGAYTDLLTSVPAVTSLKQAA